MSINNTTRVEFFEPIFQKQPHLESQIINDFLKYKQSENSLVPNYFGRDVPYTLPQLAYDTGLMHIHLKFPPSKFNKSCAQYYRVCKKGEVDACLVYVSGSYHINHFSLLAIFSPNAHEDARNEKLMHYISRVAKDYYDNN